MHSLDSDAYYNRGLIREELGEFDKAIIDYEHAIRIDTDNFDAIYNSGLLKFKLGYQKESLEKFQDVCSRASNEELISYAQEWIDKISKSKPDN